MFSAIILFFEIESYKSSISIALSVSSFSNMFRFLS